MFPSGFGDLFWIGFSFGCGFITINTISSIVIQLVISKFVD